jgi:glucan phosphoethanolaminetransferase (alkaline phosphatase superfamily)
MTFLKQKIDEDKHFKSVLMAYFILLLHVLLVAGLVLLVVFFRGIINYMLWIFLAGSIAILASGYHFYKRMKEEGKTLRDILSSPRLYGRTVEVNILGGLASFKIGQSDNIPLLNSDSSKQQPKQLEDPNTIRTKELTELVRLLQDDVITLEEYNKVKRRILKL